MKSTIIFLHGGPGFRDYLKPYFEELKDQFNCIFYDQVRGPEINIEDMISQLNEIVCSISGEIILLGHSWGAVLAAEYAGRHQSKLSGLVLISTGLNHKHWKDEYHKELEDLGLNDASLEQIFLTPEEIKEGIPFLNQSELTFSEETFMSINKSYLGTYDVTPYLKTLFIPVINIFGEKDVRFPARIAKNFNEYKSDIINFQIASVGHFPFLQESGREQIHKILKEQFR